MNLLFSSRRTASPYINLKPQVAAHRKKGSEVLESTGMAARGRGGDFRLEYDSGQGNNIANDDYFPTIEELLHPTSREEDSIQEPPNAEHAVQEADQQFVDCDSSFISIIH